MSRIVAACHFSYPWRACGSETVMQELMVAANQAGHETRLWCTHQDAVRNWRGTEPDIELYGVTIHRRRNIIMAGKDIRAWNPDVIVTHHDHATYSIKLARAIGARSVFLTHNHFDHNQRPMRLKPTLTIHNSQWVKDDLERKFGPSGETMVIHPPLTPERHLVPSTGDCLTLINVNADKGALQFYELAERMPDRKFLAVVGGHGEQVIRRNLPNVEVLPHGPEMTRVWSRTRILLMPSIAESYGLTAMEAAVNGIPTIAHPTPGLVENLGPKGLFADRDDLDAWVQQIEMLDNPETYAHDSEYARSRADEALTATRQSLNAWCDWIGV